MHTVSRNSHKGLLSKAVRAWRIMLWGFSILYWLSTSSLARTWWLFITAWSTGNKINCSHPFSTSPLSLSFLKYFIFVNIFVWNRNTAALKCYEPDAFPEHWKIFLLKFTGGAAIWAAYQICSVAFKQKFMNSEEIYRHWPALPVYDYQYIPTFSLDRKIIWGKTRVTVKSNTLEFWNSQSSQAEERTRLVREVVHHHWSLSIAGALQQDSPRLHQMQTLQCYALCYCPEVCYAYRVHHSCSKSSATL